MTALTALGLQKSYGTKAVLEDATLTVDADPAVQAGCTYWKDHHYYGKQS